MADGRETGAERAFPSVAIDERYGGMTLRDWFAGQIGSINVTTSVTYAEALVGCKKPEGCDWVENARFWAKAEAAHRYIYADAMMAERTKRGQP